MAKLGIFAAVILAAAGVCSAVEARAADAVPTGASAATAASAPKRAPTAGALLPRIAS